MERRELVPRDELDFDAIFKMTLEEFEEYLGLSDDAEIEMLVGQEPEPEQPKQERQLHGYPPEEFRCHIRMSEGGNGGLFACLEMATELLQSWPQDQMMLGRTAEQRRLGRMGRHLSANGVVELLDDTEHEVYHAFDVEDEELLEMLDNEYALICCISGMLLEYPEAATIPVLEPDRFVLVLAVEQKQNGLAYVYYVDPALHKNEPQKVLMTDFVRAWSISDRRTILIMEGVAR